MKAAAMLPLLQAWAERHAELTKNMDALAAVLGSALDGPFGIAVYNTANSYTDTLSALIGDDIRWLPWYQFENDMGRKGLCVTIKGGRVRRVRNLRQLARVIEECAR
jgi:hypothetical protein